jgi:ATP-dependent protease ClpP protease subunit
VRVEINSAGGEIGEAFRMHDALRRHLDDGGELVTVGVGAVWSAALTVFLAAEDRRIGEAATVLVHGVRTSASGGTVSSLRADLSAMVAAEDLLVALLELRAGLAPETTREWLAGSRWLDGAEAIEFGIATSMTRATPDVAPAAPSSGDDGWKRLVARRGSVHERLVAFRQRETRDPAARARASRKLTRQYHQWLHGRDPHWEFPW